MSDDVFNFQTIGSKCKLDYIILSAKYKFTIEANYSLASVEIRFKRRVEYHIYNTFLQTLTLTLVGCLSFLFDVNNFSDRVMVTLTTMLVVATLASSIQQVYTALATWLVE